MSLPSAARGVSNVITRCEAAKETEFLDLSHCGIMYIADAIYLVLKGYEVTKVSLGNNELKKFPKKMVEKFPNMTVVNCDFNEISELPDELSAWTKMRGINASHNKLSSFPDALLTWSDLAIIDLSSNLIEELDVERFFGAFPRLVAVNLSGNPLKEEIVDKLQQLKPANVKLKLQ